MSFKHPNSGDLYTPISPQMLAMFERMKREHGTWRQVSALSGIKLKQLRNMRSVIGKTVSQRVLDKLIQATGVGSLEDYIWFTPEDLIALGIWDPVQYVAGYRRIHADVVVERTKAELKSEAAERKKQRKRERRLAEKKSHENEQSDYAAWQRPQW